MNEPVQGLKISVAIASRGRPAALAGVVMAAWRLQSGRNAIAFPIAVDEDDTRTLNMIDCLQQEQVPVVPIVSARAGSIGATQNRAMAMSTDADIVTLLTDRMFVITPGWDYGIAESAIKYPNRVLWWSCPNDPDTTVPIIPHTILERMDWRPLPEVYPFWFTDTHLMEIDRMVFGGPSLRVRPMFSGARGNTQRGRDFRFWTELFIALRPERTEIAKKLCADLGLEWKYPSVEMLEDFHARDRHLLTHADDFQRMFGDTREPGPEYEAAKAHAEDLLADTTGAARLD